MSKRGAAELVIFILFAIIAVVGLAYTLLESGPSGMAYHGGPWQDMPLDTGQIQSPDGLGANGLIPPQDQPGLNMLGSAGSLPDCQSQCFGTGAGYPTVGAQPQYGGASLRQCLSDCSLGTSYEHALIQECYACSCPAERITADDENQALVVCKRVCGGEATISDIDPKPCTYH